MTRLQKETEYFEWLCSKVPSDFGDRTYKELLRQLYLEDFKYDCDMDQNRATQGTSLRQEYANEKVLDDYWMAEYPCSVLEMMIALAEICESRIMQDETKGNQTGRWFWDMVSNMGLMRMDDKHFDAKVAHKKIQDMLEKNYDPDGRGGLFMIPNLKMDIRKFDIWYQAMLYLSECLHQKPLQFK